MMRIIVSSLLVSAVGITGYIFCIRGEGLVGPFVFLLFWALWTALAIASSYLVVVSIQMSKMLLRIVGVFSVLFSVLTFLASSPMG